ncbi:hypothetical protein [Streptosporangium roseum]|uniref:hypothetical protein n=1 Tax=Streptosporangium roseum TaxID=2001 RepID=UPI0033238581
MRGNPQGGVDALSSMIFLFNGLDTLSRRLPGGSHVQGIITRGGEVTNVVPDLVEGLFCLRALTTAALEGLVEQVRACAESAAAMATATVVTEQVGVTYSHFRPNPVLSTAFSRHLARLGVSMSEPAPGVYLGSSDIGNVSTAVPTIHPFLRILPPDRSDHTPDFAVAAGGPSGRAAMLAAAEALACTAIDLLGDPSAVKQAWQAFDEQAVTEGVTS